MNSGKYVFAQLLQVINRYDFEKCVARYNGNHRVRELNCWNLFIQLFFGQLTARSSLRDICISALDKTPIKELLTETQSNQNVKEQYEFFDF
jgi:hypothetical protein